MMSLPWSYIVRNLWVRRLTSVLTGAGMGLVVFVFATVLMLSAGLRDTLVSTGADDNIVVIRRASQTEIQSGLDRAQLGVIETQAEIALGPDGTTMSSREVVVLIVLPRRGSGEASNITIRGTSATGIALRPQARLAAGRWFRPGSAEIVVGRGIAQGFDGAEPGQQLRFGGREWTVVGVFDAGRTAFNSEVWGDAEQMMQAFRRPVYSSLLARLGQPQQLSALRARLEQDPRLTVDVKAEPVFYAEQSEFMATFLNILGVALSLIFSVGVIIGAVITMYASVANRVGEIGTLRALGFPRRAILAVFLFESMLLALCGGAFGLLAASLMQFMSLSTMNWQTFSELAFSFTLTPGIAVASLLFAALMGLLGGFLPALRAARLNIVDALRAG